MKPGGFNWQIWLGFIVSIFAFLSYPFIFVEWPLTRDFPWVNILLLIVAAALVFIGVRRAFGPERGLLAKIGASILAGLSVLVVAAFIMMAFVGPRWMPSAAG